jgi:hypothetical protein
MTAAQNNCRSRSRRGAARCTADQNEAALRVAGYEVGGVEVKKDGFKVLVAGNPPGVFGDALIRQINEERTSCKTSDNTHMPKMG